MTDLPLIAIKSLLHTEQLLISGRCSGVYDAIVSIGGPDSPWEPPPEGLDKFDGKVLRLEFNDVLECSDDGFDCKPPSMVDVASLISFLEENRGASILFHCAVGVSRSSAAAYIYLCILLGPGREEEALRALLDIKRMITPNRRMVQMADQQLGRDWKMRKAHEAEFGGWQEIPLLYREDD